ncbi:MAG: hypothetical protein ACP5Q1_02750, partial [Anaerolineae bacterium]
MPASAREPSFASRNDVFDFFRACQYNVNPVLWDYSDLPRRAQDLIGAMYLVSHYDDPVAPFQVFLVELQVPSEVKRIRRTDLRTILDPFYRRFPQGNYLFAFALPQYRSFALVSPKRIRAEQRSPRQKAEGFPEPSTAPVLADSTAIKTQLRILTLDPQHLYHTDQWVLDQICLSPGDQTAKAIWQKHLQAFDVERVTDQFYEDYTAILEQLKAELGQQAKKVGARSADVHAFAQQLLNRLLFLYFVQKKDWLRWDGGPDRHYLRTLWQRYCDLPPGARTGFYAWLKALFFDAFNNQRAAIAANRALPEDVRTSFLSMPFLNGGLFEHNEWDELNVAVPDYFFTALFDRFCDEEPGFLERYNFTVDESTALEIEVAVDPEMLGKVYESQVQREERHGAGIFYTPREEIDYMCRLSLIKFLHEQTQLSKDDLIPLVMEPRRLFDTPADSII